MERHRLRKYIKCILFGVFSVFMAVTGCSVLPEKKIEVTQKKEAVNDNESSTENTDLLKGLWTVDEVTSFLFDGKGSGALCLPSAEYSFFYQFDGNRLSIDFEEERAEDVIYIVKIEDEILEFFRDDEIQSGSLILHKKRGIGD